MAEILTYRYSEDVETDWDDLWMDRATYSKSDHFMLAGCPYCKATLRERRLESWGSVGRTLATCSTCGWWRVKRSSSSGADQSSQSATVGMAKRYATTAADIPIADLRRFLRQHPSHAAHTHPTAFERLVCDCIASAFPGGKVRHVGQVNDGGIDGYLLTHDSEYLIQVKRRSDLGSVEGVKVVRELNGVLMREGKTRGIVVTTARAFSRTAQSEARVRTPLTETYEMKLLAFDDFVEMLNLPAPLAEPWLEFPDGAGWAALRKPGDYSPPEWEHLIYDSEGNVHRTE